MPITVPGSLDVVVEERDFELEAAQACLARAFRRRLKELHPEIQVDAKRGKKEGWQHPLADEIGVSQYVISRLSRGQVSDLQLSSLLKLQRWIGRPLDEILGITRDRDTAPPKTLTVPSPRR